MMETVGVIALILIVAVLIFFKVPQKAMMAVGGWLSKLGK